MIAGGGTGGHLYPALNLAEALRRRGGEGTDVLLVGARRGVEARVFAERGVPHRLLPLHPLYRSRPWRNWRTLASSFAVLAELRELFADFAPGLVVGTGGYAAGPVVAMARVKGVPTALQEQNSYPGLATRWLAPYVDQLHLGYREALRHLQPGADTVVRFHGNPIRWPDRAPQPVAVRRQWGLEGGRIVIVVGGSQGAAGLNRIVLAALERVTRGELPDLPGDARLFWATGPANHPTIESRLREIGYGRVTAVPYIDEMEKALSITSVAVSRAGALMLAELCAWGVPALLVPLPHAAADHQRMNAQALAAAGAAALFEEDQLAERPDPLWLRLRSLLSSEDELERMAGAARARGNPHAADQIASDLWQLLEAA